MCIILYNMCDDMKFDYTVSEYMIYIYTKYIVCTLGGELCTSYVA